MTEAAKPKPGFAARAAKVGGWILLGVAGFMLNEALAWARDAAMDKPDYLQDLAKKQEQEFKDINDQHGSEHSLMGALRQMKASLLHSKLDYEGQLKAIGRLQGVVETTPTGEFIWANDIYLKLLG